MGGMLSKLWRGTKEPYLEGELAEASTQTGQRLKTSTSLGHNSELGGRGTEIAGGDLEAGDIASLE